MICQTASLVFSFENNIFSVDYKKIDSQIIWRNNVWGMVKPRKKERKRERERKIERKKLKKEIDRSESQIIWRNKV